MARRDNELVDLLLLHNYKTDIPAVSIGIQGNLVKPFPFPTARARVRRATAASLRGNTLPAV